MIVSHLFSIALFSLTFGIVTSNPVPKNVLIDKRAGTSSDVQAVFTTLKQTTDTILPKIDSLVSSATVTEDTVTPLISSLTNAINTATSSLAAIEGPVSTTNGPSEDDIAGLVAGIITDVITTLNSLNNAGVVITPLAGLLAGVDVALNQVLLGLGILLSGVLRLVATLLADVAGLLQSLGFGLLLTTLSL